jgi:Leucine-rich repeat (LRR) protein
MSKKNVENARKFLWDDDEGGGNPRSRNVPQGRFSTRDYAVDQSVNLMAMGEQPTTATAASKGSGGGVFGLFRGGAGGADAPPKFDEYGDAAPSAESEEYISDKRRRSPVWAALANSCACCGRMGGKGVLLVCCALVGIILLTGGLYTVMYDKPMRQQEIQARIVESGMSDLSSFDVTGMKNPQKEALKWIVHQDPAKLPPNHEFLLERYALAVFYFGTNGPIEGWKKSDNWMTKTGYCMWFGVECIPKEQESTAENNFSPTTKTYDDNAPITGIVLPGNKIEGTIPSEFGQLTGAMTLDFQENYLSGDLPPALTSMKSLRALLLRKNNFVGTIHKELTELTGLHELHLGENHFAGPIPPEINNMKELRNLALSQNLFTGTIPEMTQLTKLRHLYLDDNDLAGIIPSFIKLFIGLFDLRLGKNKLSGSIVDTDLQAMTNLEVLQLNDNQLTGTIPNMFDHIPRISDLQLQNNKFSGTIPETVTHLNDLKKLRLDQNKLTGILPANLGVLPDVEHISLNDNELSGSIATIMGRLDDITYLALNNNALVGSIPSEMGTCFRMISLHLEGNQLTGEIPTELGKLDQMTTLRLETNNFNGVTIPSQVCSLTGDDLTILSADCKEKVTCDCCDECV